MLIPKVKGRILVLKITKLGFIIIFQVYEKVLYQLLCKALQIEDHIIAMKKSTKKIMIDCLLHKGFEFPGFCQTNPNPKHLSSLI